MPFPTPAVAQAIAQAVQWKVDGEVRMRLERRIDRDFSTSLSDNRTDALRRIRIGVKLTSGKHWTGSVQYQYAHDLAWTRQRNFSDEDSNLFVAQAQWKEGQKVATIGRQRVNLGSERLIGSLDWVNTARSYDGLRFEDARHDVFAGRIGVQSPRSKDARIAFASRRDQLGASSLIFKHDRNALGALDIWTLARSYKQKFGGIEIEGEGALQAGHTEGKDHRAWAVHLQASRPVNKTMTATLEVNAASGGQSPDRSLTFDNLYPTNHKFYGILDMHAWRNMNQVQLTFSHRHDAKLDGKLRISKSWLRDERDAWYGASGRPNLLGGAPFRDLTGSSGRDLGWEVSVEATYRQSPACVMSAGIGIFSPGGFVRKLTGDNQAQTFAYLMFTRKF